MKVEEVESSNDDVFIPRIPTPPVSPMTCDPPADSRQGRSGAIKRPRNPFIFYRSHLYKQMKAGHITTDQNNVSKEAGVMWHSLSKVEQQPFVDMAAEEKRMYELLYPGYKYAPGNVNRELKPSKPRTSAAKVKKNKSSTSRRAAPSQRLKKAPPHRPRYRSTTTPSSRASSALVETPSPCAQPIGEPHIAEPTFSMGVDFDMEMDGGFTPTSEIPDLFLDASPMCQVCSLIPFRSTLTRTNNRRSQDTPKDADAMPETPLPHSYHRIDEQFGFKSSTMLVDDPLSLTLPIMPSPSSTPTPSPAPELPSVAPAAAMPSSSISTVPSSWPSVVLSPVPEKKKKKNKSKGKKFDPHSDWDLQSIVDFLDVDQEYSFDSPWQSLDSVAMDYEESSLWV